jgi:hypothetical protein
MRKENVEFEIQAALLQAKIVCLEKCIDGLREPKILQLKE